LFFQSNPFETNKAVTFTGVPDGCDALLLAELVALLRTGAPQTILHVASDETAMARTAEAVRFFAPAARVLTLPAWDCLPYDRVPPRHDVMASRLATLSALASAGVANTPALVVTTASAALQRMPTPKIVAANHFSAKPDDTIDTGRLTTFLSENGYLRTDTVREPGEFAIRGGIIDIFPPGTEEPLRLDLFGDVLEGIRGFDALSQRTTGTCETLDLMPANEVILAEGTAEKFRSRYREMFGAARSNDALYEAVSAGVRHPGMEHWLPLFYDSLATVFDYVDGPVVIGLQTGEALSARHEMIADYYNARVALGPAGRKGQPADDDFVYNPLPPDALYLREDEWQARLDERAVGRLEAFRAPATAPGTIAVEGRRAHDFAEARNRPDVNLFEALGQRVANDRADGQRAAVAAYSAGSRDRMVQLMHDHGMAGAQGVETWSQVGGATEDQLPVFVLGLDTGFSAAGLTIYTEQDVLGDRLVRGARRTRRAENFIAEVASLSDGDLVVHVDHGIGRFDGWKSAARRTIACDLSTPTTTNCSCRSRTWSCCRASVRKKRPPSSTGLAGSAGRRAAPRSRNASRRSPASFCESLRRGSCATVPSCRRRRASMKSSVPASPIPKPTIRRAQSTKPSPRCRAAGRWTGWYAATSASARPRSPCAPRS
jgi:transcription-repair coupling factor (superfamily II helicase)